MNVTRTFCSKYLFMEGEEIPETNFINSEEYILPKKKQMVYI